MSNVKLSILVLFLCVISNIRPEIDYEHSTASVNQRIQFLKFQLQQQLKALRKKHHKPIYMFPDNEEPKLVNDNYDYVDLSKVAITPINENDDRKIDERYKLRQLRTTTTKTTTEKTERPMAATFEDIDAFAQLTTPGLRMESVFNPLSDSHVEKIKIVRKTTTAALKKKKKHHHRSKKEYQSYVPTTSQKPLRIFYKQRRDLNPSLRDVPLQWTHCVELISPYLRGFKELTTPMVLGPTHRSVLRLVHLLKLNVTEYTKQDIYSLMYQISNLQIRLFQWSPDALKVLFNAICKGKKHSFLSLKYGMKQLFAEWHLDFTNVTNLVLQSRLFRPECTNIPSNDGSTKSSNSYLITSKFKAIKKLEECDDESKSGEKK